MDWLADLIVNLPLDDISDALSSLTFWWSERVDGVSPEMLPLYAYVGFSIVVLVLWLFIVRVLPKPIGGMSWILVLAVLLTPTTALGDTGAIAPASIAVVYGVLMKDTALAASNLLSVLVVFTVGLLLGLIWQLIKNLVDSAVNRSKQTTLTKENVS